MFAQSMITRNICLQMRRGFSSSKKVPMCSIIIDPLYFQKKAWWEKIVNNYKNKNALEEMRKCWRSFSEDKLNSVIHRQYNFIVQNYNAKRFKDIE